MDLFLAGDAEESRKRLRDFGTDAITAAWKAPSSLVAELVDLASDPGVWHSDWAESADDVRARVPEDRLTEIDAGPAPKYRALRAGMYEPAVQENFRVGVNGSMAALIGVVASDRDRLEAVAELLSEKDRSHPAVDELARLSEGLLEWVGAVHRGLTALVGLGEMATVAQLAEAHAAVAARWTAAGTVTAMIESALERTETA